MRRDIFTTIPSTNLIIVTRSTCAAVMPTSLNHELGSYHGKPTSNKRIVIVLKNLKTHILPTDIKSLSSSLKFLKIFSKEKLLGQNNCSLSKSRFHCTIHTDVFWDAVQVFYHLFFLYYHSKNTWYSRVVTEPNKNQIFKAEDDSSYFTYSVVKKAHTRGQVNDRTSAFTSNFPASERLLTLTVLCNTIIFLMFYLKARLLYVTWLVCIFQLYCSKITPVSLNIALASWDDPSFKQYHHHQHKELNIEMCSAGSLNWKCRYTLWAK